jgi:hypothetical protein
VNARIPVEFERQFRDTTLAMRGALAEGDWGDPFSRTFATRLSAFSVAADAPADGPPMTFDQSQREEVIGLLHAALFSVLVNGWRSFEIVLALQTGPLQAMIPRLTAEPSADFNDVVHNLARYVGEIERYRSPEEIAAQPDWRLVGTPDMDPMVRVALTFCKYSPRTAEKLVVPAIVWRRDGVRTAMWQLAIEIHFQLAPLKRQLDLSVRRIAGRDDASVDDILDLLRERHALQNGEDGTMGDEIDEQLLFDVGEDESPKAAASLRSPSKSFAGRASLAT